MTAPTEFDSDLFARGLASHLSLRALRLLRVLAAVVTPRMHYAIGGAVALQPAGYPRNTDDIDVFARKGTARKIERSLLGAGLVVERQCAGRLKAHFPDDNRPIREGDVGPAHTIDVHVASNPLQRAAILTAVDHEHAGLPLKFVRPTELAVLKFLAARPQDLADVEELIQVGKVDVAAARALVATFASDRSARSFMARVRAALRPRTTSSRYLSRQEMREIFAAKVRTATKPGRTSAR